MTCGPRATGMPLTVTRLPTVTELLLSVGISANPPSAGTSSPGTARLGQREQPVPQLLVGQPVHGIAQRHDLLQHPVQPPDFRGVVACPVA